ncbi:MAG: PAS domain S-box protein [Bacillota bacterium]
MLRGFAVNEREHVRVKVEQAQFHLLDDLSALGMVAGDWAARERSRDLLDKENEKDFHSSLQTKSFQELRLNLILYLRPSGSVISGTAFDFIQKKKETIPQGIKTHLSPQGPLMRCKDESGMTGIISLPDGIMMVVSRPMMSEDRTVEGYLVMGRYLDAAEIEHMSKMTHLSVAVQRFDDQRLPPDYRTARSALSGKTTVFVNPLSKDTIAAYAVLNDIYGKPAVILRVDDRRTFFIQGKTTVYYFLLWLLIIGLGFSGTTRFLWRKLVLSQREKQESEERYRAVVEQTAEGIFLVEADTRRLLEANAAFQNLFGYIADEIPGLILYDFCMCGREDIDFVVRSIITERRHIFGERQFKRKDGSVVNVEISANMISYGGKEVLCFTVRDITKRKRADEALKASEEKFRNLFHNASDAIILHLLTEEDMPGRIIEVNDAMCRRLGYSREELLAMTPLDVDDKERLGELPRVYKDLLSQGHITFEMTHVTKKGRKIPVEISTHVFKLNGVKVALSISRDITERKRAEEAIKLACLELNQIFSTAADGMRVVDKEFNVLRVNERFCAMAGISMSESLGNKCYEVFRGAVCHSLDCPLNRILLGEERVEYDVEKERKDGNKILCTLTATPFRGPDGELVGIVENFRDITGRNGWKKSCRRRRKPQ